MKRLLIIIILAPMIAGMISCNELQQTKNDCYQNDIVDSLTQKLSRLCREYNSKARTFAKHGNLDSALRYANLTEGVLALGDDMGTYFKELSATLSGK